MYLDKLTQDEIFVHSEIRSLYELTGIKTRRGFENAIISNGKIVNVVSSSYGHIPNELFFKQAERLLIDGGISYQKRTINRNDRTFITDFIIVDDNQFNLKNSDDSILPMLRFKNSYDGSEKTSGHFGFYRKVCSNGLHVSQAEIAFSMKHNRNAQELIIPKLHQLFQKFLDNEYYEVLGKFELMKTIEIIDTKKFVRNILQEIKLFRYECSDTNEEPSKKSRMVLDLIDTETLLFHQKPNLWLGYNAFNSVLHNNLKKSFTQQEQLDKKLFETIYSMV
ncbi:MAG: DUF932 domain-containing protein [Flavobacteriaceae bacterium]